MTTQVQTNQFTGRGRAGDWSDPNNWGGHIGPAGFDIVPMSTTEDGAFTARILMMLGQETVTVNGALTTTSPGLCISMMVCEGATAVFNPTASLHDAGGLIVGNDGQGTLIAHGTAGGAHATLEAVNLQIGKHAGSAGSVTLDGAALTSDTIVLVGQQGQGTLALSQGGTLAAANDFLVGAWSGSAGTVTLAGGSLVRVGGDARIGTTLPAGTPQGTAQMSIDATSRLDVAGMMQVGTAARLTLGGGTIDVASPAGLDVNMAGVLAGHGTVSASTIGLLCGGTIEASGGTLTLGGAISGDGTITIDSGATAALSAATIGGVHIAFAGASAALDLAHGVASEAAISGFAAGDSIVMAGVDQLAWDGAHDVLTLIDQGKTVDQLHILGSWGSADPFSLAETSAGAVITLASGHV